MEVFGKPCDVPLYGLNECARFDLVETGRISAEHQSMAPQEKVCCSISSARGTDTSGDEGLRVFG